LVFVGGGDTALLDRGGIKKLESLGARLAGFVEKPLDKTESSG
jgi:hypothetical protein